MSGSVASVTLAYNATRFLQRHIEALRRQTRGVQEIIVVDSASTDGTGAMLAEQYPCVTALSMAENLGAAGAWAAGDPSRASLRFAGVRPSPSCPPPCVHGGSLAP